MNRIAEEVEKDLLHRGIIHAQRTEPESTGADAIAAAARQSPRRSTSRPSCAGLRLPRIACCTRTAGAAGDTDLAQSRDRGRLARLGRALIVAEDARPGRHGRPRMSLAFRDGFAKSGQRVIVVAGVPLERRGDHAADCVRGERGGGGDVTISKRSPDEPQARSRASSTHYGDMRGQSPRV
jgi:pyruvate kinase